MIPILRAFLLLILFGAPGAVAVVDSHLTRTEQQIVQFIEEHNDEAMALLERVVFHYWIVPNSRGFSVVIVE
jgi:hypothetical protein